MLDIDVIFWNLYQFFVQNISNCVWVNTMLRSRRTPLVTTREGCAAQFRTVLDGANSSEFSKQKAALTAFNSLCENQCVSALIYIMRDFSESDDPLKQHLAKKAKEYLKRTQ